MFTSWFSNPVLHDAYVSYHFRRYFCVLICMFQMYASYFSSMFSSSCTIMNLRFLLSSAFSFITALSVVELPSCINQTKYFYKSIIDSLSKKSSTPMYKMPSLSCLGIMLLLTITIFLNESSIFLSDAVSCSLFTVLSTFKADWI